MFNDDYYRVEFRKIYSKNLHNVVFFANSYLHDMGNAEGVAHEVFIVIWNNIDKLDLSRDLQPYILTLTKNRCLNILRARKAKYKWTTDRFADVDSLELTAVEHADSLLLSEEIQLKVDFSLSQMSTKIRDTFLLHRNSQLSYSEIATYYGISEKTVEYRILSALRVLRKNCKEFLILFLGVFIENM